MRLLREQAEGCARLGSPFHAELLNRIADDVAASGPAAVVLAGHELDPGPAAIGLRLVGTIHRLVLSGTAPELAPHYPSVGGDGDVSAAWPKVLELMRNRVEELQTGLLSPPQTNEVGRAAALIGGLLHVADRFRLPVRLHEIGASGGLNLRADHFRIEAVDGSGWGPVDSPVQLPAAWQGHPPPVDAPLEVVERGGCDVSPLDATTPEGALRLQSYVWPDQRERLDRLRGAMEVAKRVPAEVRAEGAATYLRSLELREGTVLVVWHSVMWQYLDRAERAEVLARLDELGRQATAERPLAHLLMEPRRRHPEAEFEFLVVLQTWPDGEEHLLGTTQGHGVPVTWE